MNQVQPKITSLQNKGQITLPAQIRRLYNLQPGSMVRVSAQIEGIVVEPIQIVNPQEPNEFMEVLRRNAKSNNTTVEKLLADFEKTRQESFKKTYPKLWKKLQKQKLNAKN